MSQDVIDLITKKLKNTELILNPYYRKSGSGAINNSLEQIGGKNPDSYSLFKILLHSDNSQSHNSKYATLISQVQNEFNIVFNAIEELWKNGRIKTFYPVDQGDIYVRSLISTIVYWQYHFIWYRPLDGSSGIFYLELDCSSKLSGLNLEYTSFFSVFELENNSRLTEDM